MSYISAVRTILYAELGWKNVLINCGLLSHYDARRLPDHKFPLWRRTDNLMKQPLCSSRSHLIRREHVYPSQNQLQNRHLQALQADVIGSHRYLHKSAGNWKLYLEVLEAMMPVFFATNRYRYSKWLTVHINGITVVVGTASEVYAATAYGLEQEKPSVIICYIFDQIQPLRGI